MKEREAPRTGRVTAGQWLALGLILLVVAVVRIRLLDFPLERDEGEFAYMGQLILDGAPPYAAAYNMKLPGTAAMYALAMSLFGQTAQGIHLGLLLVNCVSIVLLFLLARLLMDGTRGLIAAAAYAALSLGPSVLGFAAHATHFVVLFALGGALVLLEARRTGRMVVYGLSGLLFGLSFVMKQPGLFFVFFGAAVIVSDHFAGQPQRPFRNLALPLASFLAASSIPYLAVLLWVLSAGTFDSFWFWTVRYAVQYGSEVPLSAAPRIMAVRTAEATESFRLLWVLACLGALVLALRRDREGRKSFGLLFLLFSLLTVVPGFYFRTHYFVSALPAAALGVAEIAGRLNERSGAAFRRPAFRHAGTMLFVAALIAGIVPLWGYFFRDDPTALSRRIYDPNPFPWAAGIASGIEQRSRPQDSIAVFGSEPEIYFYAHRPAATGFLYTYSLLEDQPYAPMMQEEMAREIEASRPRFIVDVHVYYSWLVRRQPELGLFRWFNDYVKRSYRLVGVLDILPKQDAVIRWDDDARNYAVRSSQYVLVYERKGGDPAEGAALRAR